MSCKCGETKCSCFKRCFCPSEYCLCTACVELAKVVNVKFEENMQQEFSSNVLQKLEVKVQLDTISNTSQQVKENVQVSSPNTPQQVEEKVQLDSSPNTPEQVEENIELGSSPNTPEQVEENIELGSSPSTSQQLEEKVQLDSIPSTSQEVETIAEQESCPSTSEQLEEKVQVNSIPNTSLNIEEKDQLESTPNSSQQSEVIDKDSIYESDKETIKALESSNEESDSDVVFIKSVNKRINKNCNSTNVFPCIDLCDSDCEIMAEEQEISVIGNESIEEREHSLETKSDDSRLQINTHIEYIANNYSNSIGYGRGNLRNYRRSILGNYQRFSWRSKFYPYPNRPFFMRRYIYQNRSRNIQARRKKYNTINYSNSNRDFHQESSIHNQFDIERRDTRRMTSLSTVRPSFSNWSRSYSASGINKRRLFSGYSNCNNRGRNNSISMRKEGMLSGGTNNCQSEEGPSSFGTQINVASTIETEKQNGTNTTTLYPIVHRNPQVEIQNLRMYGFGITRTATCSSYPSRFNFPNNFIQNNTIAHNMNVRHFVSHHTYSGEYSNTISAHNVNNSVEGNAIVSGNSSVSRQNLLQNNTTEVQNNCNDTNKCRNLIRKRKSANKKTASEIKRAKSKYKLDNRMVSVKSECKEISCKQSGAIEENIKKEEICIKTEIKEENSFVDQNNTSCIKIEIKEEKA